MLLANVFFFVIVAAFPQNATPWQKLLTAFFFAIQTVTTTGYGSGFGDITDSVKFVACIFMIVGYLSWGVFVAELAGGFAAVAAQRKSASR